MCFCGLWSGNSATAHLGVGPGRWNNVSLLLIYQHNLLLLFLWTETLWCTRQMRGGWGSVRAGGRAKSTPQQHRKQTSLENLMRNKSSDLFAVFFTQIKSFGHDELTSQQGAYLSLTQLQYKTVGKRQKNCKKGFLCSRSTTHRRHCIPGFYIKALEVSFFVCVFTFSCKQLCEKCLQPVLKSEMCIRYAAWVLWPIYIQSLCFYFFHVPFLRGWECQCVTWAEVRGG